jgi:hypothetical protein
MEETARMVTESLQAGKSDMEVLLETLLAKAKADRIRIKSREEAGPRVGDQ